eukprot:3534622-Rhodomonas_salina.2
MASEAVFFCTNHTGSIISTLFPTLEHHQGGQGGGSRWGREGGGWARELGWKSWMRGESDERMRKDRKRVPLVQLCPCQNKTRAREKARSIPRERNSLNTASKARGWGASLRASVALAEGDGAGQGRVGLGVGADGVEVDRDRKRNPQLVVARVPLPDARARVVDLQPTRTLHASASRSCS